MSTGGIIGIVLGSVVVILVIAYIAWYIATKNKFVKLEVNIEEAFSTMDVYLKKRYDLIPNLVETVKGYAKHESETFTGVIEARNKAMNAQGSEKFKAEGELTNFCSKLFALQEAYPQLKADGQYMNLQRQLQSLETEISQARKYYNANVKIFNVQIRVFPSSIIANKMRLEKKEFFEIETAERENVKVSF